VSRLRDDAALGQNFTVREFTRSPTAARMGLDNSIEQGSAEHRALVALVDHVLQPMRTLLGVPLVITSGFRGDELNEAIGGVATSQHRLGEAADLCSGQYEPMDLAQQFITAGVPFDQLILEHDQGVVHVSHSRDSNRREVLTRYIDRDSDRLVYAVGLQADPGASA